MGRCLTFCCKASSSLVFKVRIPLIEALVPLELGSFHDFFLHDTFPHVTPPGSTSCKDVTGSVRLQEKRIISKSEGIG